MEMHAQMHRGREGNEGERRGEGGEWMWGRKGGMGRGREGRDGEERRDMGKIGREGEKVGMGEGERVVIGEGGEGRDG